MIVLILIFSHFHNILSIFTIFLFNKIIKIRSTSSVALFWDLCYFLIAENFEFRIYIVRAGISRGFCDTNKNLIGLQRTFEFKVWIPRLNQTVISDHDFRIHKPWNSGPEELTTSRIEGFFQSDKVDKKRFHLKGMIAKVYSGEFLLWHYYIIYYIKC